MQRLKIDIAKFTGAKTFTAKDGVEFVAIPIIANHLFVGAKGTYMDLTLMDNRDGTDQYGNNGFITQDVGKDKRDAGIKGAIIGNWKHIGTPARQSAPPSVADGPHDHDDGDDIPF